jgi:hypothetical protein
LSCQGIGFEQLGQEERGRIIESSLGKR